MCSQTRCWECNKNEHLLSGMQVFMLFEAVVCVHRRSVGSAKYEQLLSGMQNFVLFETVVGVPTRGDAI